MLSLSSALHWIYPPKCGLCDRLGPVAICNECQEEMEVLAPSDIRSAPPLDFQFALFQYEGRAGQAVRRLKMSRITSLAPVMSAWMFRHATEVGIEADWVVPVPLHWSRRSWRGFNQAEMLAEPFPDVHRALLKTRRTKPQVTLNADERGLNLIDAFRSQASVAGKSILLIDDVLTTGSTARYCAEALKAAGAREVGLLAFCAARPDEDNDQKPVEVPL